MLNVTSMIGGGAGVSVLLLPTTELIHHWLSDTGVTGTTTVTQWDDQVGSRDVAEATNGPALIADQIDGFPSIRFDGSNDHLHETTGDLAHPVHMFVVLNQISWVNYQAIIGEGGNLNNPKIQQRGTSPDIAIANESVAVDATVGTWSFIAAHFDGTSSDIALNGGTPVGASGGIASPFTDGLTFGGQSGSAEANIEFAEIAIYSAEQVTTQLADIEAYFSDKYASLSIA